MSREEYQKFAVGVDEVVAAVGGLQSQVDNLRKKWDLIVREAEMPVAKLKIGNESVLVTTEQLPVELEKVLETKMIQDWADNVGKQQRLKVQKVHIQHVDMFGSEIGFVKFKAAVRVNGKEIPGIAFMRGGAVAVLVVLRVKTSNGEFERYTLGVRKARIAAASSNFLELPKGKLDGDEIFSGDCAEELKKTTDLVISASDLFDMTKATWKDTDSDYPGMYPTCGGSDEFNRMYLFQKDITAEKLNEYREKCTGTLAQGEIIKTQILPLKELWRNSADSKALSALCLYRRLSINGKLPPESEFNA